MALLGNLLLGFLFSHPLRAILIRHRATYRPSGGSNPDANNKGFWLISDTLDCIRLLIHVWRTEGIDWYIKGVLPYANRAILFASFMTLNIIILTKVLGARTLIRRTGFQDMCLAAITDLIMIPHTVVLIRAVTTSQRLPWFEPENSLKILLSNEVGVPRRLTSLYFLDGIFVAELLRTIFQTLILGNFQRMWFRSAIKANSLSSLLPIILDMLTTCFIIAPLDVIVIRLSLPQHPLDRGNTVATSTPLYKGFDDCWRTIAREETPMAFFRGAVVTWLVTTSTAWIYLFLALRHPISSILSFLKALVQL